MNVPAALRGPAGAAIGLAVLALVLAFFSVGDHARRDAAYGRGQVAAFELGVMAGLRERQGATTAKPLRVEFVQEGGPLWVGEALEAAFADDPAFEVGTSAHLIRAEVIANDTVIVTAPSLFRQGWGLRLPAPLRIRLLPWIVALASGFGIGIALRWRALGVAGLACGVLAQGLAWGVGWPSPTPELTWIQAVSTSPLGSAVTRLAVGLTQTQSALAIGLLVMCAMLIGFDHRRSRGRGGPLLIGGSAGVIGAVLLLEAGSRTGLGSWASGGLGLPCCLCIVGSWACAAWLIRPWVRPASKETTVESSAS